MRKGSESSRNKKQHSDNENAVNADKSNGKKIIRIARRSPKEMLKNCSVQLERLSEDQIHGIINQSHIGGI